MNTERDYEDGYTYEEQHIYVTAAWQVRAFGLRMSDEADEIQDYLTVERLRELEA